MAKTRKHNYVVGYTTEGNVVYGRVIGGCNQYVNLLTLYQANTDMKKLNPCGRDYAAIFKLVPVKIVKGGK